MLITLFLLPALLPICLGAVLPRDLSYGPDATADLANFIDLESRNKPPEGWKPEDEDEDCDDYPTEVNNAATGSSTEDWDDEDCDEEDDTNADDQKPPTDVDLAASGSSKDKVPTEVNNVAIGVDRGGGVDVAVPAGDNQGGGGAGQSQNGGQQAQNQNPNQGHGSGKSRACDEILRRAYDQC